MNILGISCFFHDAAAALVRNGVLIAAAEEERFTRKKHDYEFPINAIRFVLEHGAMRAADVDYVVFFEKPFVKFERILLTVLQTYPRSADVFRKAMLAWMRDKLWIKNLIVTNVGVPADRILFSEHHLSHAASAFYCSPFDSAALLTVDGVGEWATATFGIGRGTELSLLKEIRFPHSLGLLYSAFTAFLGFEVNEGEYKVMGMAPYGQPRYREDVEKLIRVERDGSFWLNMDYFSFHYSSQRTFTRRFVDLFGPPRDPNLHFFTRSSGYPAYFGERPANYDALARLNEHYADVAASIQVVTEEALLNMARALHRETGLSQLCLAGGVALNSVANGRLLRETPFRDIYIQPAAGDAGGAVGAALYAYHAILGKPRQFVMDHAAWGAAHPPGDIRAFLTHEAIPFEAIDDEDRLLDRVAETIAAGKVVGWFHGRFEWGPRALGQRSILADPRRPEMKDVVNTKIKFREPYRPFAPSVLAESADRFFELPDPAQHYPGRFMLYVVDVKPDQAPRVPAITHVDGTARPQAVFRDANPRYYELISRFGRATGVPVLLNTSFNLRGEPIVASPRDAWSSFIKSEMDVLVLENFLVEREKVLRGRG